MKHWKAIFGVLAVFFFGIVTGALGMLIVGKTISDRVKRGGPEFVNKVLVKRLTHDIKLDAAQQKRAAEIVAKAHQKIIDLQQSIKPDTNSIFMEASLEFRGELRPDQQQKFDDWLAKESAKNNIQRK